MPYKQTSTQCIVRLVAVRGLSSTTLAPCAELRQEAGRLWTDLVHLHGAARAQRQWLSAGALEQATKGGQYALHSQSVQALCQKFAANVETATELRQQELTETGRNQTATRLSILTMRSPTRPWCGRTRRSRSCPLAISVCPPEASDHHSCCHCLPSTTARICGARN